MSRVMDVMALCLATDEAHRGAEDVLHSLNQMSSVDQAAALC